MQIYKNERKLNKNEQKKINMLSKEDIELLEKQLPPNYKKRIVQIAKVSRTTVWNFFNNVEMKPTTFDSIYSAIEILIKERKETNKSRQKMMAELRKDNAQQNLPFQ